MLRNAYLILAHRQIDSLHQLVDALDGAGADFFIHIDAKTDVSDACLAQLKERGNVWPVPDVSRVSVQWGGFSQVSATMVLMEAADRHYLARERVYAHLLSGMDYPIRPVHELTAYLSSNYGAQYLDHRPLPYHKWSFEGGMDRLRYYWFVDDIGYQDSYALYSMQKERGMTDRRYVDRTYYGGSQWWSVSRECLHYLAAEARAMAAREPFFRQSLIPDEIFFHTLLMHSPFAQNVINDNLRYIDWLKGPEYPRMLNGEDWEAMRASGAFFARKIDFLKEADGLMARIRCLDRQIAELK